MFIVLPNAGYSSHVCLDLYVDKQRFPLAQIGAGRLIFDHDTVLPGSAGEVVMSIDGREHKWHVEWDQSSLPRSTVQAIFTPQSHPQT
jgi:hypothetical protein